MPGQNRNQIIINKKLLQIQKELNAVRDALFWARKCRNAAEVERLSQSEKRLLWMIDAFESNLARRPDVGMQTLD